jgi:hypothetical protein
MGGTFRTDLTIDLLDILGISKTTPTKRLPEVKIKPDSVKTGEKPEETQGEELHPPISPNLRSCEIQS